MLSKHLEPIRAAHDTQTRFTSLLQLAPAIADADIVSPYTRERYEWADHRETRRVSERVMGLRITRARNQNQSSVVGTKGRERPYIAYPCVRSWLGEGASVASRFFTH